MTVSPTVSDKRSLLVMASVVPRAVQRTLGQAVVDVATCRVHVVAEDHVFGHNPTRHWWVWIAGAWRFRT